jgi:nickel superoxide dismutase
MFVLDRVFEALDHVSPPRTAYAHCDVPCGIYDPQAAQIAAQTVQTMVTKMQALTPPAAGADLGARQAYENSVTRMITTKEEHAERVKREILILWTDYFKPPHFERWPDLHSKVNQLCKTASQCKQEVNADAAQKLRDQVEEVANIFWESKK